MFTKLIVPLDGTPEAAVALPPARTIARATGASIRLVRVVDYNHDDLAQLAAANLRAIEEEVKGSGVDVSSLVRRGEPAAEIVAEASASGADLVVMATHGRSGLGRAVLGSVADGVVTRSPTPVLLLRPGGHRLAEIRTVLVPVDGSPGGALAVGVAVTLARPTDARVVLVEVIVPLMSYTLGSGYDAAMAAVEPSWDDDRRAAAHRYVSGLAARLRDAAVDAEGRVVDATIGSPNAATVEALDRAADAVDADLIVMSTHALTGPARAVLGSVADAVVRRSHRPVLLVRRDAGVPTGLVETEPGLAAVPTQPGGGC